MVRFKVHLVEKLYLHPIEYLDAPIGMKTFLQPLQIEWYRLVEEMTSLGYKGDAELYYLKPGCEPPAGLVKILGPQEVDEMMVAHAGTKICHLYIVNGSMDSDNDDGGCPNVSNDLHKQSAYPFEIPS